MSGVKLPQLNGFLNKDLYSVKNAYVSPKKFTPDLQIFYTFPAFGLNVHVLGVQVPPKCKIYPRPQDFLHGYIRNIRDIMQLWVHQSVIPLGGRARLLDQDSA